MQFWLDGRRRKGESDEMHASRHHHMFVYLLTPQQVIKVRSINHFYVLIDVFGNEICAGQASLIANEKGITPYGLEFPYPGDDKISDIVTQ